MKWAVFAVTKRGAQLAEQIEAALEPYGECRIFTFYKYARQGQTAFDHLGKCVDDAFGSFDGLVFVAAVGIAVRSIAPHVKTKLTDPAVIVVDENARHAISLLSGHIGRANAFTEWIAQKIGAQAVITTATDTGHLFSPDSFACANQLLIREIDKAKSIAVAVLDQQQIGFYSEYPHINLPRQLHVVDIVDTEAVSEKCGICISAEGNERMFEETLHLVPRNLILGVGCRRQTAPEVLEGMIFEKLEQYHVEFKRICGVATIDLKKEEPALLHFCKKYSLPLHCFGAEQLKQVSGEFSQSEFVRKITGVDNICERSAVALAGGGSILVRKQAQDGVTMAVVEQDILIDFNKTCTDC